MLEFKKYSLHRTVPYIRLVVVGIVIGASGLVAFASYQAYLTEKAELAEMQRSQLRDKITLLHRYIMWYGEVESVNVPDKTITAQFRNQFVATDEPLTFTVHTTDDTAFIYQQLIAKDGAYVGLSENIQSTLSDIQPHMRVATFLENVPETNELVARTVIFGNPL